MNLLGVEHAQIKSDRLKDPRFEHYYHTHGLQFLDVIERSYFAKLTAGHTSLIDFYEAMKNYVALRKSGSQGRQRKRESHHIIDHVLGELVWNGWQGRLGGTKSSRNKDDGDERPRNPRLGPSQIEGAVQDILKSDERRDGS